MAQDGWNDLIRAARALAAIVIPSSPGPLRIGACDAEPEGRLTAPDPHRAPARHRVSLRCLSIRHADGRGDRCLDGLLQPGQAEIAVELVEERLELGDASGYFFVFAEQAGQVLGYTSYGPIAGTAGSFDLYWIANRRDHQGRGLGRVLMQETERLIRDFGGRRVYAETSGRPQYEPTRVFYERLGFFRETHLQDFYAPGDDKVFFVKVL
jgi:GNAT superfamily N-acetyltransferase